MEVSCGKNNEKSYHGSFGSDTYLWMCTIRKDMILYFITLSSLKSQIPIICIYTIIIQNFYLLIKNFLVTFLSPRVLFVCNWGKKDIQDIHDIQYFSPYSPLKPNPLDCTS